MFIFFGFCSRPLYALLTSFNSSPAGGQILPPCRIFSIAQKRQQISTRNFHQYLLQHQFGVYHQNFRKSVDKFLRKWRFSDVMLHDFGSKNGTCLKPSRMYRLKVKHNPQTLKDAKLSALQNAYLRFLIFFYFDPKLEISNFQKINA